MAPSRLRFSRERLAGLADAFVIAIAVSLPWSTSATGILVAAWAAALFPVVDWSGLRRTIMTPAGGFPVVLVVLGIAGMLWADVSLVERWKGLDSFLKLLAIPLLLVQFRASDRGIWVFAGYLASCVVLLAASTVVIAIPPLARSLLHVDYTLVKNGATQSGEFVTCIFGMLYLVVDAWERRDRARVIACATIILAMLASIVFVATGRTALLVALVLLVVFAIKRLSARGVLLLLVAVVVLGAIGWTSSPYLQQRTTAIWTDLERYKAEETVTSSGERLVFWKKSIDFISQAPVIGHGTGTIRSLFEKSATGRSGAAGEISTNPHNQTFAVGIQLGLIGIAALWAMWIAHLMLFRGDGLAAWIGLTVVVQNFVGSLFNSHVFDFTQGWVYAIGVGVAGAMVYGQVEKSTRPAQSKH
ncbi:MAG TPA: O-antigen ligase family protein [Pseudolabrys sp.]|nr:O-antigen ligase family protein [Pseudolabrys sp.]